MLCKYAYEVARIVMGEVVAGNVHAQATGLQVNHQRVQAGDIFVAFAGKTTDGHRFIDDAIANGATIVLVSATTAVTNNTKACIIRVDHPLRAIQRLATEERRLFSGPVIGVTGSNGKTTTKEMLASVFGGETKCLFTADNMNTELGLPLTILRRASEHRAMVLEMGMRGRGQIAELCNIATPTAGVITNIGQSHLELLGSQENIAKAKAELLTSLPSDGFAALPAEDAWVRAIAGSSRANILWYGIQDEDGDEAGSARWGDLNATHLYATATQLLREADGISFTATVAGESARVKLATYGRHNVLNALSALALGAVYGHPLAVTAKHLGDVQSTAGRLHVQSGQRECTIIDDCYNASPLSVKASLGVLRDVAGPNDTVAILGDMYELGPLEQVGHREIGEFVANGNITLLITIGPLSRTTHETARERGARAVHFDRAEDALSQLHTIIPANSVVLVKASRGMHLEQVVSCLIDLDIPPSTKFAITE